MKKIITLILISVAFAMANFNTVDLHINIAVKRLKNCKIYTGIEAYERYLSPEHVKDYTENGRAVYYDCDNGYFMYSQHDFKGSFISGEVCKGGYYDYVEGCSEAKSYFMVNNLPFNGGSSDGYFIEIDKNGIRTEDTNFKTYEVCGKSLALRVYKSLQK